MNRELGKYLDIIQECGLFSGMDSASVLVMLDTLHARLAHFNTGEIVMAPGDGFTEAGIVLDGRMVANYIGLDGTMVNLKMLDPGDCMGVEYVWKSGMRSPVCVSAVRQSVMLMFCLEEPRQRKIHTELEIQLLVNIADMFTANNISLSHRVWMYGQKHIRARLKIYFMSLPRTGDIVTLPMKRSDLADYLGVDRSALFRELSRMQREGLIDVDRRNITLRNAAFFSFADHNGGDADAKENGQSAE